MCLTIPQDIHCPSRTHSAVHHPTPVCKTRGKCCGEQQVPLCVPSLQTSLGSTSKTPTTTSEGGPAGTVAGARQPHTIHTLRGDSAHRSRGRELECVRVPLRPAALCCAQQPRENSVGKKYMPHFFVCKEILIDDFSEAEMGAKTCRGVFLFSVCRCLLSVQPARNISDQQFMFQLHHHHQLHSSVSTSVSLSLKSS